MKNILSCVFVFVLVGCAGKTMYTPPSDYVSASNEKIVNKPIDKVWKSSVSELGKRFFVINNLDKASGLINISYSGSPESYIDCGRVYSYVSNARGERTYDFPAAQAEANYEIMGDGLYHINRKMTLEGRINLIFESVSVNRTKVTANTKYVVTRTTMVRNVAGGFPNTSTNTISFNTGGIASFPMGSTGTAVTCKSTGKLEQDVLNSVN